MGGTGQGFRSGGGGGVGGTFAGRGTTNQGGSGGAMSGYQGEPDMQDPGKKPDWEEEHEAIYAPERTDVQTTNERVSGQKNEGGRELTTPVRGAPEKQPSMAPYYEVYDAYATDAEEALNREDIPRSHERKVREYFKSIQPDRSAPGEGE